jgi:hypothetical protein
MVFNLGIHGIKVGKGYVAITLIRVVYSLYLFSDQLNENLLVPTQWLK